MYKRNDYFEQFFSHDILSDKKNENLDSQTAVMLEIGAGRVCNCCQRLPIQIIDVKHLIKFPWILIKDFLARSFCNS